ncbi:MAG: sigma-70 family RNA polymerase sigma factor [Tannerella sp.]|jgi:RNA polymerase sigma-70 factor (ECF subfamily)|nr:sigma-70 family RNA polymerase sigma factor [Tannerella sp.]
MESASDTYYVRKVQAGETRYFAPLLERYSHPVFSLIVKMTGNREDAEELTQDVFLKVYRSLGSFLGECRFSTWLYRIAYNTAISSLRKQKHEWLTLEGDMLENVADEENAEPTGEDWQLDRLEQALAQLPPDERALILLFYRQEKRVEEIATIMGLSVSNVKTRLHRVRKRLQALMQVAEKDSE